MLLGAKKTKVVTKVLDSDQHSWNQDPCLQAEGTFWAYLITVLAESLKAPPSFCVASLSFDTNQRSASLCASTQTESLWYTHADCACGSKVTVTSSSTPHFVSLRGILIKSEAATSGGDPGEPTQVKAVIRRERQQCLNGFSDLDKISCTANAHPLNISAVGVQFVGERDTDSTLLQSDS